MELRWRKSSFSEDNDGNCLELASCDGGVLVRESDAPDVVVAIAPQRLQAFLASVKAGRFDDRT
ncbi:DUF397 domain-containing protein [Streptomyces chattanoogensis]|uniref:DUF397 domain-containing protein n=1 Tax=Streptomyces chattanoogensis TaxID=66876 RepID=A0A0N0GZN2_9ACTN|nr:DUF397 domain-containing protein [Streptomyces chattanoogensis]KPC62882.1 hypothetical protein ADL29_16815 [Streptomyces chattanoogensis]